MRPFVTVIVPVRDEARAIAGCLTSILTTRYPRGRMEVVVADGMSCDGTREIVSGIATRDARIRLIDNPGRTTPRALNQAIAAARGDVILRVDAHSVLAPDYIEEIVGYLEAHPDAWGVGGRMRTVAATPGAFGETVRIVLTDRFGVGNSGFRTSSGTSAAEADAEPYQVDTVFNCAWPREVFRRVGEFHEQLERSQDIEFSTRIRRAGGTLWLTPRAETVYFARAEVRAFLRHNWINGIWAVLPFAYVEGTPVRIRHLIPLVFVAALAGSTALALLWPRAAWAPILVVGPYALANLGAAFAAARRERKPRLAALLPAAFAGLHLSYGAGSLWGAARLATIVLKNRWRKHRWLKRRWSAAGALPETKSSSL